MPEVTPAQCAADLEPDSGAKCRGCGQKVRWGTTTKGKRAPFDPDPPYVNHFITCPERGKFKKKGPH